MGDVVPLVLLGFLAVWRIAPQSLDAEATDLILVMLWAGLAFPLCFLILGTRRGLYASVGIYRAFVALVVPAAVAGDIPHGTAGSPGVVVMSLAVFFAVSIALLWVLASRLEALAAARVRADLLAAQATTDPLTGLPNRRHLDDELERQVARARRNPQPLAVMIIDIDHFKDVNDRFGHEVGDRVLRGFAARLTATVRGADVVGRWGGEEFLLVAPHTDLEGALELAERGRAEVTDQPFSDIGPLTASFGVAAMASDESARSLVRRADLALYAAKRDGRDRVTAAPDEAFARV